MADLNDVGRIALSLPETTMDDDRIAFSVTTKGKRKGIAWVWMERVHPKQARVPNLGVLAIRGRDLAEKDMLLAARRSPEYALHRAALQRLPGRPGSACRDRRRRARGADPQRMALSGAR